jgi:hypothetical protein
MLISNAHPQMIDRSCVPIMMLFMGDCPGIPASTRSHPLKVHIDLLFSYFKNLRSVEDADFECESRILLYESLEHNGGYYDPSRMYALQP